ncbi:MAG: sigma-54-dependent transcriptional regulator [Myxococcota bacterium]
MPERQVLIIDDEPVLARLLEYTLDNEGYVTHVAHTGEAGRDAVNDGFEGVVLLDLKLPDVDGLDLVEPILTANPANRIVIMTAHGSIDAAIEATRKGAYDFLTKTDDLPGRVRVSVKNAFRDREMAWRVTALEEAVHGKEGFAGIVARSPQMMRVFETLRHAVESRVTVMIQGESGTGKELIARALHTSGSRSHGTFVALNCAGIPDTLLESELFGHERGAFTGAVTSKPGKFELADGGTIFLDEIGEMSLHLQSKILRVLETREIDRLGGSHPRPVDVRVVSATHRDLEHMVQEGTFREDLYYRLAVFPIRLPPLREREGDVPLLAYHFMRKYAEEEGKAITGIDAVAMRTLELYSFPGNVRELENIISRAVVVASGVRIGVGDLPPSVVEATRHLRLQDGQDEPSPITPDMSLEKAFELLFQTPDEVPSLETVEGELIRRALRLHDGKVVHAAKTLGMSRATLYRRLDRLGGKQGIMEDA